MTDAVGPFVGFETHGGRHLWVDAFAVTAVAAAAMPGRTSITVSLLNYIVHAEPDDVVALIAQTRYDNFWGPTGAQPE